MSDEGNGRYTAGQQAAQLVAIAEDVKEIKKMLVDMSEWQRTTEGRLATGIEKFRVLEQDSFDTKKKLENRDWIGVILSVIASVIGGSAWLKIK